MRISKQAVVAATVALAGTMFVVPGTAGAVHPPGTWALTWQDEFDGSTLDGRRWTTWTAAYADGCRGNHKDHKLDYTLPENVSVSDGVLQLTAQREDFTAPSGEPYTWTSGLITTGDSCGHDPTYGAWVQPGMYLETRVKMPSEVGFWPAYWTWYSGNDNPGRNEVDIFEHHSDQPRILELTNHTAGGNHLPYDAGFDLTADWHVIGTRIGADSVDWYLDDRLIFSDPNGFDGVGAYLVLSLSVVDGYWHSEPPDSVNTATMLVDYVRVYTPATG